MSTSTFIRSSMVVAGSLSLLGLGNLAVSPVQAADLANGNFETGDFSGWMTAGDASIQGSFNGFPPPTPPTPNNYQALLTTAATTVPDDDNGSGVVPAGQYNFSGIQATNAEFPTYDLQTFLGLSPAALNVMGNVTGEFQSPTEGSAIKQQFHLNTQGFVSFDWRFLTNDGSSVDGNDRDVAFVTLYEIDSPLGSRTIQVLHRSSGSITSPPTDWMVGEFETKQPISPAFNSFSSGLLPAGIYVLAMGVYDVDGSDKTSALLIDNVKTTTVPEPLTANPLIFMGAAGAASRFSSFFKRQLAKKRKNTKA